MTRIMLTVLQIVLFLIMLIFPESGAKILGQECFSAWGA